MNLRLFNQLEFIRVQVLCLKLLPLLKWMMNNNCSIEVFQKSETVVVVVIRSIMMFWFVVDDAFVSKLFYHSLFTLCVSVPFYVSFCPHRIIITIPSTTTEFDEVVMEGLAFFSVNISTGRLKVNNLPMLKSCWNTTTFLFRWMYCQFVNSTMRL